MNNEKLQFLPYQPAEFDFCDDLLQANMSAYFEQYGIVWYSERFWKNIQKGISLLVWQNDQRVGFFQISERDGYGYINTIQLIPDVQGKGLGKMIMQHIESIFREKKISSIRLNVYKTNPAIQLYERLGYTQISEKEESIQMEKVLSVG